MRGNGEEAREHNVTRAVLDEAHRVDGDGEDEVTTANGKWKRMAHSLESWAREGDECEEWMEVTEVV